MTENAVSPSADLPPDPSPARGRDRAATRSLILEAAKSLLATKGFAALGVNVVAREAGCDKQLVYRYFGGLEGLVDAIGEDLADWVGTRLAPLPPEPGAGYGARLAQLIGAYLDALRADPLMRAIVAWEVSDPSPHVRRLSEARSRALGKWMMSMRGGLSAAEGVDAPALNALLVGAVQHLALSGAVSGGFVGVPLGTDADWNRIKAMLNRVLVAIHD